MFLFKPSRFLLIIIMLTFLLKNCMDNLINKEILITQILDASMYMYLLKESRGGSRISGKGVRIFKGIGVRLAEFILMLEM